MPLSGGGRQKFFSRPSSPTRWSPQILSGWLCFGMAGHQMLADSVESQLIN